MKSLFILLFFLCAPHIAQAQVTYLKGALQCECGYTANINGGGNYELCIDSSYHTSINPISCEACSVNNGLNPQSQCGSNDTPARPPEPYHPFDINEFLSAERQKLLNYMDASAPVSIDELLEVQRFYLPAYGGQVYFRFSIDSTTQVRLAEFYQDGKIYAAPYANLNCGTKSAVQDLIRSNQTIMCANASDKDNFVEVSPKRNLTSKRPYVNLLLGKTAGYRPGWVAFPDLNCSASSGTP